MTRYPLDQALRARVTAHLGRFDLRRRVDAGGLKRAAVAIVIVEADAPGEAAFLLTKRTPKLRAHGGQWALPGGRVDPGETIVVDGSTTLPSTVPAPARIVAAASV